MPGYLTIDSQDLITQIHTTLADLGVSASHRVARSPARRASSTTKHLVTFDLQLPGVQLPDGLRPTIGFFNSYRGESSLKLFGGAVRSVCANGCIFGTPDFCVSIRHVDGPKAREFLGAIRSAVIQIVAALRDRLPAEVRRLQSLAVVAPVDVVRRAVADGVITQSAGRLALATLAGTSGLERPQDDAGTAWGLYNILNESTRRAGRSERAALLRDPGILAYVTAEAA